MFRNYIKTAYRSLKKNKGFTAINVLGLALGLAVCLLIVFYVIDELSYDRYNVKLDRIYRVNNDIKFGGSDDSYAVAPAPLAAVLESEFPDVEHAVRFRQNGGLNLKKGEQNIQEHHVIYADPKIFSVFTFPMINGDPNTALKEPHAVVISESTANKYFGSTNVVGKTLVTNENTNYKITGVIKDIPKQSHVQADIFISMTTLDESRQTTWLSNNFQTYILLKPGADIVALNRRMKQMVKEHMDPQMQNVVHMSYDDFEKAGNYIRMNTIPLKDIHLKSNLQAELGQNGNIQFVYIFSAIALFILLIACVNFMNLSTARSANRAREVGVRKVLGSARKHLIAQFLAESIMVTLVATVIALITAWALLPIFNQMSGKELTFTVHSLIWLIPTILIIVLVIGCLAGSYPAFFLSGFQPIEVLKGKLAAGFKGGSLRSFLVVLQFSISIFLIIGTLVIYNQLKYIQNKDLGYSRSHVLVVKNLYALGKQAKTFKDEIKRMPGVGNATMTGYTPTMDYRNSNTMFLTPTLDTKNAMNTQMWYVDEDYINTLGIKMVAGRDFSKQMLTDSSSIIINEMAAKRLGYKDPINKMLYVPMDQQAKVIKGYRIVGVMKDFNFNSLRENVSHLTLILGEERGALNIRVKTSDMPGFIKQVENKWKEMSPNQQFDYSFMDQDFDATYRTEQRMGKIFVSFTSLAIIIACLGLFGLAAYAAEQRTKEIGIRKVLGAGVSTIVAMLSIDFIKLVIVSIIIAAPLAWFAMQYWLQGFAYRQNIQWWIIAVAGLGAIVIAFATISFQSVKAALINPIKSLRSE
ncbi:ABC transporter permease [Mucilaginibacter jinjuensis]|uniref:ABC transporter permease n=1 Tax=Mucilaginibacter jinjuensis TaxID=1176721 RepID=A0ABY7T2R0_9SPHI|nr:ABC transporter permease [Mucilaginibacter jinjuensis]WCT10543.1 ABC transporter permease [Mucilaginibacter jinjuensis]